jgi:nucleoside-triphosphatase THEP1
MKEIEITVTGEPAAGKSTVMYLIETLLRDNGYTVKVNLENQYDYDKSIYHFHNAMSYHKEERFAAIKENVKITLKEMPMKHVIEEVNEKYKDKVKTSDNN